MSQANVPDMLPLWMGLPFVSTKVSISTILILWEPRPVLLLPLFTKVPRSGILRSCAARQSELSGFTYASISQMKSVAPPVAKFGMSLAAACPSGAAMPLCSCSMSSK